MAKHKQKQQSNYDYCDNFEEIYGVAVVGIGGKFGYINSRGVEITPPKYDRALRFHWDVGRVQLNGKWGLVNKQGREITPTVYDEIKGHQDPIVRLGNKYGFVSCKTGELLTPIIYDDVKQWTQILDFSSRKFGKKDLACVKLGDIWGCINVCGEEIIPVKYEKIEINQSENPRVSAMLNGKWGFVDENGKEITAFEYDDVEIFRNGRAMVQKNSKFGFINNKGATVITLVYDDCESYFSYVLQDDDRRILPIWIKRGGKYGFIDINGNEIGELKYEKALSFHSISKDRELAAVVLNGSAGFIDQTGKIIIPCMYEPDFENRSNYYFYNNYANVKKNGKWGVIDANNQIIIPFLYDKFLENNHAGFRYAMRDSKKLSVDTKGNEWEMKKNLTARTFGKYIHVVDWNDVAESFRTLICFNEENIEISLKMYEKNFYKFKSIQFKPSDNIIRIHINYPDWECDWQRPSVGAQLFSVKDECSYGIFDWDEILDMEVRIEDNLTLTDSDVVAICIWTACDEGFFDSEESIKAFINKLDEQMKTIDENR